MNNYGTGSMQRAVQELFGASPLSDKAKRRILIEFAADEAEVILIQESLAGHTVYEESVECIRLARNILGGEINKAAIFNIVQATAECLNRTPSCNSRTVYASTSAAYYAASAALCEGTLEGKSIRDGLASLLFVSNYVYNVHIDKYKSTAAFVLEHATMDRHESSLRILLRQG